MDVAGGELQQMKDDEGQNDGAAPVHGARGVGGVDGLFARVADRARRLLRSASCTVAVMCSAMASSMTPRSIQSSSPRLCRKWP